MVNEDKAFESYQARIMVLGCGGGGCNTISRLTDMGIQGAKTVAINTDAKHLAITRAHDKILIGKTLTKGLGAGGYPEVGKKAAQESREEIKESLRGCDLLFVTCGLGGGTGTGAAPVVSEIAKELGAIVIAPVTFPFKMEGARTRKAEDGLYNLRSYADTTIIIENQKLLQLAGNKPLGEAFAVADELISTMIKGVTELISQPSLVNLDYADVRAIMHSGGVATIGVGMSSSQNRARDAIDMALSHPLLDVDYEGASGALIQVIGGDDLKLDEINLIGETVSQKMNPEATVMWGARVLPEYHGRVQVITIITGVKSPYIMGSQTEELKKSSKELANEYNEIGVRVFN
jgi:cell division protein FtsZ